MINTFFRIQKNLNEDLKSKKLNSQDEYKEIISKMASLIIS